MSERVLFVDDEPAVLDGYSRLLNKHFAIDTAVGGAAGLQKVELRRVDPYAVVVSDLRMPEMDGAGFLARVKAESPDTTRIALTGYADIQMAMNAVNEGEVFRFLTKPCDKEVMSKTLTAAIVQHRLVIAERELLEQTLTGVTNVLTEVLNIVNPAAFSRAIRVRGYIQHMVKKLRIEGGWKFEIAATMSQLGCVTLDAETIEAMNGGRELSDEEKKLVTAHPAVAGELLCQIPRLETVSKMIAKQDSVLPAGTAGDDSDPVLMGARMLKVALAYDRLLTSGKGHQSSLDWLRAKSHEFDQHFVEVLTDLAGGVPPAAVRPCRISDLKSGMVIQEDIRANNGILVAPKGQSLTYPWLIRLKNFWLRQAIVGTVMILADAGSDTTNGKAAEAHAKSSS